MTTLEYVAQPTRNRIRTLIQSAVSLPKFGDMEFQQDSEETATITIRRDDNIIGGAVATINLDWAYVDTLWVDQNFRGQGLGSRVMTAVESYAYQQNLNGVYLYTAEFQAVPFYKKIGYAVIGILPNRPKGYNAIYFAKSLLTNASQAQDIVIENPANEHTTHILDTGLEEHADDFESVNVYDRVFLLRDDYDKVDGAIIAHEYWGWLDVHLCYADSDAGLMELLDGLELHCHQKQIGITTCTFEPQHGQLLLNRGYNQLGKIENRPTRKICTFWTKT